MTELSEELILPAGKLLYFSRGEYSDFEILGNFIALEDITKTKMNEIIQLAAELSVHEGKFDRFEPREKIIPLMIRDKLIEEVENKEFWMNFYSDNILFDLRIKRPVKGETHE